MDNKNLSFFGEEFNSLISKRKRIFFIGLPAIMALICIAFYIYTKRPGISFAGFITIMLLLITPLGLVVFYLRAVQNITYRVIVDNFNWKILTGDSEYYLKYFDIQNLYQSRLKEFGLLPQRNLPGRSYVRFDKHNLQGEIGNHKFILQDVSWIDLTPGSGDNRRQTEKIIAQYSLLITESPCPVNCNILIKKNTILKWGINKLKRIKIENEEFEKYYDVYTDNPEMALNVLDGEFFQQLLNHKKITKDQVEILMTPQNIFLHQKEIEKGVFNYNIFISPMALCQKKIDNINAKLNVLPILNLLKNQ